MKKKIAVLFCLLFVVFAFVGCGSAKLEESFNAYSMKLVYNHQEKSLSGEEVVSFYNSSDSVLNKLKFHLYPNAFREGSKLSVVSLLNHKKAYPNGKSHGNIQILEVGNGGSALNFYLGGEDENILVVELGFDLYPEERTEVSIAFQSVLPNANHRYGYGENAVNFGNAYPVACALNKDGSFHEDGYNSNGDPFYSVMSNYNVQISYPGIFTLAHTGRDTKTTENAGVKTTVIDAAYVRDFVFVMSDKFTVKTQTADGTEIKYYYYDDQNADRTLETAVKTVKTNNKNFGKYAYKTLAVVQTNFVHGGMEYPNLVMISDDLETHNEYLNVVIHEICHQWWYGMVGSDAYNYAWLDEGLTEFSTALFYSYNEGYDTTYANMMVRAAENYNMFLEIYSGVYGDVDTTMSRPLNKFDTEPEYVYITYVKGMLFFDSLRTMVGDDTFLKCLQTYFKEFSYKNATPADLIEVFERVSKRDLESFFDSWVNGKIVFM